MLRRLIDDTLKEHYGQHYIEAKDVNGDNVLNSKIRNDIAKRRDLEIERYPRPIDAVVFENEIDIICNRKLFTHFKDA